MITPSKAKCLNPSCPRDANTRGLCKSCYHTACRLIKQGRTTWAELIEQGKAKEPNDRGGAGRIVAWLLEGKEKP
jgi:hypothetical protein